MTEQLKEAFERAQQLPDSAQNALAARILEEIEEQEWEEIISNPHVQHKLLALADKAWKEHEAGETEEGGFALSCNPTEVSSFVSCLRSFPPLFKSQLFRANPYYPGLHFKQIRPDAPVYPTRIGRG